MSNPGSGERASPADASIPRWFRLLALGYLLACAWLCVNARVFIDQVWITEWGRRLLDPGTDHSMFMLADGSTLPPPAWLGPLLAELLFRATGDLSAFRLLGAAAAVALAVFSLLLLARRGLPMRTAAALSAALLLDPTLVQSVVVGRADTLAIAVLLGGLAIVESNAGRGAQALPVVALGYAIAALSGAVWSSVLLLGPLALLHWLQTARSMRAARQASPAALWLTFLVVPGAVFALAVAWPHWQAHAAGSVHAVSWTRDFGEGLLQSIVVGFEMASLSLLLPLAGLLALVQVQPRWLAAWLLAGLLLVVTSGFYPFRIPYLLPWAVASVALALARAAWTPRQRALLRLTQFAAWTGAALLLLRLALAAGNEPPPAAASWLARLPAATRVADFGWDFYVPARRSGIPLMRSFPGLETAQVSDWLAVARPEYIVRPALAAGAWIMLADADGLFEGQGYCRLGFFDWAGKPVADTARVRAPPTPILWRLGAFKDHGPYLLWRRCELMPAAARAARPSAMPVARHGIR